MRLLVGGLVGALVVGGFTIAFAPRLYESDATVVFPMTGSNAGPAAAALQLLDQTPAGSAIPNTVYDDVLTSRRSMQAAADSAGLARIYKLTDRGKVDRFMQGAVSVKSDPSGTLKVNVKLPGTPRVESLGDLFHGSVAEERDRPYRELTARVVALLIENMGKLADEIELDRSKAQVQRLRERLTKERELLAQLQSELLRSQQRVGMVDPQVLVAETTRLNLQAQRDIDNNKASVDQFVRTRQVLIEAQRSKLQEIDAIPTSDPLLGPLVIAYQQAQVALRKAKAVYGPDSAQRRSAALDVNNARNALANEARRAASAMSPTIADMTAKIEAGKAYNATLEANREQFKRSLSPRASAVERMAFLTDAEGRQRVAVDQLEKQLRSAEVDYDVHGVKWTVLDPPQAPLQKSGPKTTHMAMLGFLLGAGLCGMSAFRAFLRYLMVEDDDEATPALAASDATGAAPGDARGAD